LLALSCLPPAGCGGGSRRDPRVLRIAWRTDVKSMDPAQFYDPYVLPLLRLLYGGLLDCDERMELVPWLAADMPTVSADQRVYTTRVRRGVRFANGRELTAEDFVYSIERVLDPATKSPGAGFLRNIRGAEAFQKAREAGADAVRVAGLRALDRYTLRIELTDPDLAFLWLLTMPYTYPVPREEVERSGDEFYRSPCGTGPFVLAEWQRDLRLRLARNPLYDGPARPGFDGLEILIGADDLTRTMMFERGELDALVPLPQPDQVRISRDPRWRPYVSVLDLPSTNFIVMNCELPPFDCKEVRQAVCHAVNRERIVRALNGAGMPAAGILPPGVFGHDPGRKGYDYDPDKARALLARAGYADGLRIELWYMADSIRWEKVASVVQHDLKHVGIDAVLKCVAYTVFIDATARRGNVACSLSGWTEDYPDASDFLSTLCDGTKIVEDQCGNAAFYQNGRVDALLHAAAVATDPGRRCDLYRRAENLIMDDAPYGVLYHERLYFVHQPWVKGWVVHPVWLVRFDDLALERP
jgi:ABC-type transport system substrate-binding protein